VGPAHLTTPTLKINSDDVRQVLENYEELAEALRGTVYGQYLAGGCG
jgi:hypothetical protein